MSTHRGLSAVVGTVFLIAVVMGALSYVTYSLDVMGNFSESLIAEESRQNAKQSEAFEISSIDVTGANKLDGVIKNTGEIPVKITTLWIDEQGVNDVVQKYTIDAEIAPGNTIDLASLIDVPMDSAKGYNMKVVSSRGAVNSFYVNSLADENVYMKLTALPTVIPSTFESTLLFTVVNNMSNGNYLYNLTPVMNDTKQTLVEGSTGLISSRTSGPNPSSYDSLGPGEVAVFSYVYELIGDTVNDVQLFNVTLANANSGNEALSSIKIKEVPIATDAGSALTSLGLTESTSSLIDVLYFHDLNTLTPNNEYPMDGSSPNSAGLTKSPNGNTLEFISSGVVATTTLPVGTFNASLNYFSSAVPLDLPEPTFAFMMDSKDCGSGQRICDMINDIDDDKGMREEEQDPDFSGDFDSGGGPDGDDYFSFDESNGDEWFQDDGNYDGLEPLQSPDTMAVWVRIPAGATSNTQPIVHFGDRNDNDDEMGLYVITGGEIEWQFSTQGTGDSVDCQSSTEYDDNLWHHIVGVRDGNHSCKLYIDGKLIDSDTASYGSTSVDVSFNAIGALDDDGNPELTADIASYMFWKDDALTPDQVEDLFYTNYGNNGTRLYMTVERVDALGTTVLDTIVPETKVELPFHDPSINQDDQDPNPWLGLNVANSTDLKYSQANMTGTSSSVITFDPGDRIKLTLDWKGEDEQNLPINIMFDDSSGWTFPDGPSFLQTPPPEPRWPTFLSFDSREEVTYRAFNEGPEGVWFTYSGTRLVLTSLDGLSSYAATPRYVNQTTAPSVAEAEINPSRDSMYIPDQYYAVIDFWPLQAPPDASVNWSCAPECETVDGDYDAALYLQGYDEGGETFKKTVNLRLVHITWQSTII